ncbi:MAG: hypothetical protein HY926_05565 [Elusimicrobia bacterium]|nr:hypothetical protein [Elusimicrobiota bacterium]
MQKTAVAVIGWLFAALAAFSIVFHFYVLARHQSLLFGPVLQTALSVGLSLCVLIPAVGLLKRREWGRKGLIGMLSAVIAWNFWIIFRVHSKYGIPLGEMLAPWIVAAASLLLFGTVICVLCLRSVREEFKKEA